MLLNRWALVPLFLVPGLSAAEQVQCPGSNGGARLVTVTLYDGPPSEHADLMPDKSRKTSAGGTESSWEVGYVFEAGRKLYVECRYDSKGVSPIVLEPANARVCIFNSTSDRRVSLVCR
jgi:hypothetical protein